MSSRNTDEPDAKRAKYGSYITEVAGVKTNIMPVDDWKVWWEERIIGFHEEKCNPILMKHIDKLICSKKKSKILFPLCGKAVDMKWLADMGHQIVGIEASEIAIKEFFEEQKVKYTIEDVPKLDGKRYVGKEMSITIYCCDFFKFCNEVEGGFDGVWDRGAMCAINLTDRQRYVDVMKSLLSPDFHYMVELYQYEEGKIHCGPPHAQTMEETAQLFGKNDHEIEVLDVGSMEKYRKMFDLDWMQKSILLIKPKMSSQNCDQPDVKSAKNEYITEVDGVKTNIVSVSGWEANWEDRNIGFHTVEHHPVLVKHADNLKKESKILFPLCGKAVDMKWLADLGHQVIGIEGVEMACKEFFEEQKLKYKIEDVSKLDGKRFVGIDNNIKIYCCDFFKFNSEYEGTFDAVWDRAALVAINRTDRHRYVDVMKSLLSPTVQYMIETCQYEEGKTHCGPPHAITPEETLQLFGVSEFDMELLDSRRDEEREKRWNLDSFVKSVLLIKPKV